MEGKGEIRRLHIIYFLSRRMGRIDHPHLIRVHHLTRSGVYLRDIKRWLLDLRGKDMPEAFAWSFKRRYKTGYVWEDLLDDDLITPISDNEYVLKGSEIISSFVLFGIHLIWSIYWPVNLIIAAIIGTDPPKSYAEKSCSFFEEESAKVELEPPGQEAFQLHDQQHHKRIDIQAKVSPEINKESSPHLCSQRSTSAHDQLHAMKFQRENHSPDDTLEPYTNYQQQIRDKVECSSFYSNFLLRKKNFKYNYKDKDSKEMANTAESPSSFSSSSLSRQSPLEEGTTKSNSRGSSSNMFRNLIACGTVDTNESAVVMLNRTNKTSDQSTRSSQDIIKGGRICKGDHKSGGSARVFGACRNQQEQPPQPQKQTTASRRSYDGDEASNKHKKERDFTGHKEASADYRLVGRPHCSQCRKLFEPAKLHSHMKSCIGMKALPKTNTASVERIPEMGSRTSISEESASTCFLTN